MSRMGPATESALSTLAIIVVTAIALSAFTIVPTTKAVSSQPGEAAVGPLDESGEAGTGSSSTDGTSESAATTTGTDGSTSGSDVTGSATSGDGSSGTPSATSGSPGGAQQGTAGTGTTGGTTTGTSDASTGAGTGTGTGTEALACEPGKNGGATDVGITADRILLASTIVTDGPGASFLAPVRTAMVAKVNEVNRKGGICGRQLELLLNNDSWDAQRGQSFIQRYVEQEKVFALAVVPSSEGLRAADGYIEKMQVPVVGTDGMLIHQYTNPWIWPVATSTISTMHIMAKEAHDRGAKNFGIVFDAKFHFGVEGAFAFNQAVKRMTGADIPGFDPSLKSCDQRFCGIQPNQSSYATEAQRFDQACYNDGSCDFVAYLLEPDTAASFIKTEVRSADTNHGYGLAQPLFNRRFAEQCGKTCDRMRVWTGYRPPIEGFAQTAAAQEYVNTIRKESSSADVNNQFMLGGYIGMSLLVTALEELGPNVTRQGLAQHLDSMTYDSGLAEPMQWRPGNHFANKNAIGFDISYSQSFNGWRRATDSIADPWVGQDIPAGEG